VSEVRSELKRVTWPSPSELRVTTMVVIVTSIVMGCVSGAFDLLLDRFVLWILRRWGA